MKETYDKQLCKTFPLLYADRNLPPDKTCMYWGFALGDGWFKIIWELSEKLEKILEGLTEGQYLCQCGHNKAMHERLQTHGSACTHAQGIKAKIFECSCKEFKSWTPRAAQVKEKFGGLRFYMEGSTDEIDKIIRKAESKCWETCEICGTEEDVALRTGGWMRTLCLECFVTVRAKREVESALYLEKQKQRKTAKKAAKARAEAQMDVVLDKTGT